MKLLVLTDRAQLPLGRSLLSMVTACADAGATHVVVRELDLPDAQRAALVARLAGIPGLSVVAAHRWLPGAWGVHLPDRPSAVPEGRFGVSCHSAAGVRRAAAAGASWATLSPFAESASKPGHGPTLAREDFAGHDIPVLALGGISPANARAAIDAGACGVAVLGAVMRAADPGAVVADLLEAVR